jgi:hypothetical protein
MFVVDGAETPMSPVRDTLVFECRPGTGVRTRALHFCRHGPLCYF